jgi:molybdenum cofactor biosynthesis enzyme MoaA
MFAEAVTRVLQAANAEEATVRIAGDGEPTLVGCSELVELIKLLRSIPQIKSIRLTTNGVLLKEMVSSLREAGLDIVTISLSSLDPDIYYFYAGSHHLHTVLGSIKVCLAVGMPTKVNVIYCRLNAREIDDFALFAQQNEGVVLRFFDLIPASQWGRRLHLPLDRLEARLAPLASHIREIRGAYSCREYQLKSGGVVQVKITQDNNCPNLACPVRSHCLEGCRSSLRIRLDGVLQPCGVRTDNAIDIFAPTTTSARIREALKSGGKL